MQGWLNNAVSSTTPELVGVHLGRDLPLQLEPHPDHCIMLCDSWTALLLIQEGNLCLLVVRACARQGSTAV